MSLQWRCRRVVLSHLFVLICSVCFANDNLFKQARTLQRNGEYDEAISAFGAYLSQPVYEDEFSDKDMALYTDALVQLMNTYQSKGEPEACVVALQELFKTSPILQDECLRDYYSVLGYALSRTENMAEAEEAMLKAFTIPLRQATPERYFRDYAYAAAVFYSNPNYQEEVIGWCQEALVQAELCENTSGAQWVMAMLGSLYKRNGHIDDALEFFRQSKQEAEVRNDELGVLNSLHTLVDLFLYWNAPEYADLYASEAVRVERGMTAKNPMVSAQTYIDKGRVVHRLGVTDSVQYYTEKAREHCRLLPYNNGMVDVDLLSGTFLTERGGESVELGIQELQRVAQRATVTNRAKAYHQLAQTYLRSGKGEMAEAVLDSMYTLLNSSDSPLYISLDYQPILEHYKKSGNRRKADQYVTMMLQERQSYKENRINFNIIKSVVELKEAQQQQQLRIIELRHANQRLWFLTALAVSVLVIVIAVWMLRRQKRQHRIQMKRADEKFALLVEKLKQSNSEKEKITHEIYELLNVRDKRQELESLTPSLLQKGGESKFRQCFELLYPLFLPHLRERIPTITRREELLSMLIVLKQDNREIAELLAIAPRSVLMLRHRFRQKIGMGTDNSLENFIEEILQHPDSSNTAPARR